jgi:ribosomal protein L7Ae-like RNA K-turn-binding protein
MSVLDALKGVLKLALMHDGLARGLREASKALDRRQAHMCVLNEACEEEAYKKLVIALCSEHKIPLIKVPDGKQLGEWAGLCEYFSLSAVPLYCGRRVLAAHGLTDSVTGGHPVLLTLTLLSRRRPGSGGQRPQSRQLLLRRCQGLG